MSRTLHYACGFYNRMPHIIPLSNHNDNFARPPTDASIATHIENILKRNYVELASGRKLVPTKLGLVLANGYHLIDASLVLPQVRADIEKECDRIAKGLADKDAVLKKAIDIFATKFANFVENVNKMDVLFGSSFAKLQDVGQPFTRCGKTRHLSYIVGPPPRLYNKWTEEVFPLPSGGLIKQATGQKCPLCSFELCLYQVSFFMVDESPLPFLRNGFSSSYSLLYLFSFRSVVLQLGLSHFARIASTRKIGPFPATMRALAAKDLMKTTSTRSDRYAELLAGDPSSSNVPIPTTTLSSRRGPSRRILILVALSSSTLLQISTGSCRLGILQSYTFRRRLRRSLYWIVLTR